MSLLMLLSLALLFLSPFARGINKTDERLLKESAEGFAIVFHFDNPCKKERAGGKPVSSLPDYLVQAIEQSLRFNRGTTHVLITNAKQCGLQHVKSSTWDDTRDPSSVLDTLVHVVDFAEVTVPEMQVFTTQAKERVFKHLFSAKVTKDSAREDRLYMASAERFFYLQGLLQHTTRADTGIDVTQKRLMSLSGSEVPAITSLLLVEGDNLLYTNVRSYLLPALQQQFPHLAGAEQNHLYFTASLFWVSNVASLQHLTSFLVKVGSSDENFLLYTTWISNQTRERAHKGSSGYPPLDANGRGIRPFAVNEMTLLAYYKAFFQSTSANSVQTPRLKSFPLFPSVEGMPLNSYQSLAPQQLKLQPYSHVGAVDPGSWGQYLGGTYRMERPPGFISVSHHIGDAINKAYCRPAMRCACEQPPDRPRPPPRANTTEIAETLGFVSDSCSLSTQGRPLTDTFTATKFTSADFSLTVEGRHTSAHRNYVRKDLVLDMGPISANSGRGTGHTAPFVRCCAGHVGEIHPRTGAEISWGDEAACGSWEPLLSLHVHSKNTRAFLSRQCQC